MSSAPTPRAHHVATACAAVAGLALTGCILLPIAQQGVGAATPMRGLSDLILAGTLSHQLPSWAGVLGYIPAFGGALLLLSELLGPTARLVTRIVALLLAGIVLGAYLWLVPWTTPADVGPGLQLGCLGLVFGVVATLTDRIGQRTSTR